MPDLLAVRIERCIGDFAAHLHKAAHDRPLAHNFRVALDVMGGGRVLGERTKIRQSAGAVLVVAAFQGFFDGDDVSRPAMLDQARYMAPDPTMIIAVEIAFAQDVGNSVKRRIVQKQAPEHRLLRFN